MYKASGRVVSVRTIDMSLLVTMTTSDSAEKIMVIYGKMCWVASEADGDIVCSDRAWELALPQLYY